MRRIAILLPTLMLALGCNQTNLRQSSAFQRFFGGAEAAGLDPLPQPYGSYSQQRELSQPTSPGANVGEYAEQFARTRESSVEDVGLAERVIQGLFRREPEPTNPEFGSFDNSYGTFAQQYGNSYSSNFGTFNASFTNSYPTQFGDNFRDGE